MSSSEYLDWKILEAVDPWGQTRLDWLFADLKEWIGICLGVKRADGSKFLAKQLLISFRDGSEETSQSPERIEALMKIYASVWNASWKERGRA